MHPFTYFNQIGCFSIFLLLLSAEPPQDVFLLPHIPWVGQGGSNLLVLCSMIIRLACHASVFVLSPFIFCRSNVLIYGTTCLTLPAPRSRHTQMAKAQSILLRRLGHPLTLDVAVEKLSYHHSRKSIKTFPLIEWIWRSRVRGTAVRYPFIGLNSNSFIKLGGSLNYWAEKRTIDLFCG